MKYSVTETLVWVTLAYGLFIVSIQLKYVNDYDQVFSSKNKNLTRH